jgi:hypothetical protein
MVDVGIGDLFEDGFGFGSKTAKTIKDAVLRPRRYFLAAQTKDWNGFTPSIRVYVTLLALSSYFRYLYIGEGQLMTELYVGQFEQVVATLSEQDARWSVVDPRALTNSVLDRLFLYTPFATFALYTIFGLLWRAYAEPLNAAVRVRYIYALLIPANLLLLLAIFPMTLLPSAYAGFVSFGSLILTAGVVAITAYLGAYPAEESAGGKFGRAFTLGIALVVVMLVATIGALMLGIFVSMAEVAEQFPPRTG